MAAINNCQVEFEKALDGIVSKSDAMELYDELERLSEQKRVQQRINKQEALLAAREEITNNIQSNLLRKKLEAEGNLLLRREIQGRIGNFSDPIEGMRAYLVGSAKQVEGARDSAEMAQFVEFNSITDKLIGQLIATPSSKNPELTLLDSLKDNNNSLDIAKEMFGESTGNADAKKIGEIIKGIYDTQIQRLNRYGAQITAREDYIAKQTHNSEKLTYTADSFTERMRLRVKAFQESGGDFRKMRKQLNNLAYNKWKNFILPRLDEEQTFKNVDDADRNKFLRSVWDNQVFNRRLPYTEPDYTIDEDGNPREKAKKGDIFKFTGPANLAKRVSQERIIHFKDGQSWFEYNEKYGNGTLINSIVLTLKQSANATALLRKFGTNPRAMWDLISQETFRNAAKSGEYSNDKINRWQKRLSSYFDMLDGTADMPVSYLGAKIGSNLRAWQTMSKLGAVVFSSFPDLALRSEVMRMNGLGVMHGYVGGAADVIRGTLTPFSQTEKEQIALRLGVWSNVMLGDIVTRFAPFETPQGITSRAMMRFFKLGALEFWDKTIRTGSAADLAKGLEISKNTPFDKLPSQLDSILKLYGITEKEWDLIRNPDNLMQVEDGSKYITPDSAFYYTRESVAEYLGMKPQDLSEFKLNETRNDIYRRLLSYFIDQTNKVNLRPGIEDKYFFLRGTRPGTVWGEVARFIAQFKYYSVSYINNILKPKVFGLQDGLVEGASPDMAGLANVMIGTTILGYVSMNAKNIIKNRTPVAPDSVGAIIASIMQGGGLGIFGDFIFGNYDRFGHGILNDIAGPVLTSSQDFITILFKLKSLEDPSNMIFRWVENNTPFLNLFYLRASADFLLLNGISEYVNPGGLQRYENAINKNSGQSYLIDPLQFSLI